MMYVRDGVEQFNLITVIVGKTPVEARPSDWKKDDEGYALDPLAYRTTCPHCSQLLSFKAEDVVNELVYCTNCGAGKDRWDASFRIQRKVVEEPFQDPIAAGLMTAP